MKIHENALKRVSGAQITGVKLAELFKMMATQANAAEAVCNSYTLDYQHGDQDVDINTWIPQIVLVLRPAE